MAGDVWDHIKEDLQKSGYPLEMKVARSFQRYGFATQQAVKYVDASVATLREIDVVAISRKPMPQHLAPGFVELRFVVECKHMEDKRPWIMFIGDTRFRHSQEHFKCLDMIGPDNLQLVEARSADDMPVISHTGDVAYGLRVMNQRDDAYAAIQQVNSAVVGLKPVPSDDTWLGPTLATMVPVVVIDCPLAECRLDSDGNIQLNPVSRGLLVTKLRAEDRLHAVWVVTDAGLDNFLDHARRTIQYMTIDR